MKLFRNFTLITSMLLLFGALTTIQASQNSTFKQYPVFYKGQTQCPHCSSNFLRNVLLHESFQVMKKHCFDIDVDLKRNPHYCGEAFDRNFQVEKYFEECSVIEAAKSASYKLALEARERRDTFLHVLSSLGALAGCTVGSVLILKCKSFQEHNTQLKELRQLFDPQVQKQNLSSLSEALDRATGLKIYLSQMPTKEILTYADITREKKLTVDNLISFHEQCRSKDIRHIVVCVVGLGLVIFAIIYPLIA